ncbi:unnamed protein product [Orchesella dallaii]|uniref:Uncharacterized protein n=1 Tax=Orchesella dallaii TaxID=48710 RepID=A0ABP1R7A3_9HEXA
MDAILSSLDSNGDAHAARVGNGGEEAGSSISTISAGGGIRSTLDMEVDINMGNSKEKSTLYSEKVKRDLP